MSTVHAAAARKANPMQARVLVYPLVVYPLVYPLVYPRPVDRQMRAHALRCAYNPCGFLQQTVHASAIGVAAQAGHGLSRTWWLLQSQWLLRAAWVAHNDSTACATHTQARHAPSRAHASVHAGEEKEGTYIHGRDEALPPSRRGWLQLAEEGVDFLVHGDLHQVPLLATQQHE